MTTISPILDTLLHDVLGRKVQLPALRRLDETVTAVRPAAPLPHPGQHAEGAQPGLSPVALAIGKLLGRFQAPASVLRVPVPLVPAQTSAAPALLAAQLRSSVNESGLFYEAHLARWYRGALPQAALLREPQMNTGPATAGATPEIHESLQGVVRHQLELLAAPVLRLEAEVWAGLVMQLSIRLPEAAERREHTGTQQEDDAEGIRSELNLDLKHLGQLKVVLQLAGDGLYLGFTAETPRCLQLLQAARPALLARLLDCGFHEAEVRIEMQHMQQASTYE